MVFLDNFYSYAFKNGQPRSKIQNILQLKNKHYDVAFFGSSRSEKHVDCKLITELTGKSCKNFGISGGSLGDMLIIMKHAKNRKLTFNQIFVQVDYNYNNLGISEVFKANLIPYVKDTDVNEQLIIYNENLFYINFPFYNYMIFDQVVGLRELSASLIGRAPNSKIDFSPNQGIGNDVAGSFPKKIKETSEELNQMLELYKNTNTKLEFFTTPYCNQIKNREFIDKVKLKLPSLHNYIDLFDNKDSYFFNCGHLNKKGAEIFTKIIVQDILLI